MNKDKKEIGYHILCLFAYLFSGVMFCHYYFDENTHSMIFWGVLTLLNGGNLNRINNE